MSNIKFGWKSFLTVRKGGAGILHNITKPRPWRGGAQVIENAFEDAQPLKRVEAKRQEWREQLQVDTREQLMDDKPWENDALHDLEKALPPLQTED